MHLLVICASLFLICSVSSGLVVPPPVAFGSNALVPSSPTEQEQAKGKFFCIAGLGLHFCALWSHKL